ncbi:MAG: hypothetical protein J6Q77_04185 [Clostridia bacterium]|nr:hypothetical protein [Clostridia bacterium]
MIRGINRQMIIMKTDRSSAFEAAYFLVRTDALPRISNEEMVSEANRLIAENNHSFKRKNSERLKKIKNGIPFFLWGSLAGMILMGALWLISR